MLIIASALVFSSCERPSTREVKALTVQLQQAQRHSEFAQAENLARQILQRTPENDAAWATLVEARLKAKDVVAAQKIVSEWRTKGTKPRAKLEESAGDVAMAEQDEQRAILQWQKALGLDPRNEQLLQKIALLEHERRHWAEEEGAWSGLIRIDDSAEARLHRAIVLRQLHSWSNALADLQKARDLAPNDSEVRKWLANFERLGKFLDEIRELDADVATSPTDSTIVGDRALVFLRANDPELALPDTETAAKLAPWAIRPKLLQAIALEELNRVGECAALRVRQSIRLEQLAPEVLESIRRLDTDIALERTNSDLFVSRAWQLNEIGQPALAREDAETALKLSNRSAGALAELSYALMKLGRPDDALMKIKLATDLDPRLATAWQYRGEIEMARSDQVAAVDSLTHALSLNQTAIALQKRAECYRRLGYNARAEEDLRALEDLTARAMK